MASPSSAKWSTTVLENKATVDGVQSIVENIEKFRDDPRILYTRGMKHVRGDFSGINRKRKG